MMGSQLKVGESSKMEEKWCEGGGVTVNVKKAMYEGNIIPVKTNGCET